MEGTVKSLTKFGAFIALPNGSTGMVHISEVSYSYVTDIHDHLKEGDAVKVMVIGLENGKINLSIKKTLPPPKPQNRRGASGFERKGPPPSASGDKGGYRPRPAESAQPKSFDDMLKQFMTESDSKMSSIKQYSDHKTKTRRR